MSLADLLIERVVAFIPILLSLTVHEWAHAWTAWKLGDDTAKLLGRVSLNPIDHIDPIGTLLLPLLGIPFGWAKPVPINPLRFRPSVSMPLGVLLSVAAGPISNLVLAALSCLALFGLTIFIGPAIIGHGDPRSYFAVYQFATTMVVINILLACFNLLPIPPLDGSRIVDAAMPDAVRPYWNQFTSLGPLLLAAVLFVPMLLDFSVLAWPARLASKLIIWVTGTGLN